MSKILSEKEKLGVQIMKDLEFLRKNAMIREERMDEKTFDILNNLPTQIKNLTLNFNK